MANAKNQESVNTAATSQVGIKQSWDFYDFLDMYEGMKTPSFTNPETGERFKSLAFINGKNVTLVGFSSKLGELPNEELERLADADKLQILQLESGTYKLCKKNDTWGDFVKFSNHKKKLAAKTAEAVEAFNDGLPF